MPAADLGLLEVCSPEKATIHIVLIHGLNGGRSSTWTNNQNQFWPEWIGQQIPGARVWVYGYNANVWFTGSHDHIVLHATLLLNTLAEARVGLVDGNLIPTVLIGHSLGGILIKQAMVLASSQRTFIYSYLFDAVVGVTFCGTPHRGSIWANRLCALSLWQVPSLVSLLRSGIRHSLSDIADRFNNVWGQKRVLTFVETRGMPVLGIIVQQDDAITNCSSEEIYSISKDHREMVKPAGQTDAFFLNLKEKLNKLEQITLQAGSQCPTHLPPAIAGKSKGLRNRLYVEFCRGTGTAWENRLYPSGDLETGRDDHNAGVTSDNFDGGIFYYNWPPGSTTCITMIVDITTLTFEWSITSPDSLYYPGRHAGTIDISPEYPFKPVRPRWKTPRLCPFVSENGYLSPASGAWADIWSPAMKLDHVTSSLACIIHYGPLLDRMPPSLQLHYIAFHPFYESNWIYMTREAWFRNATNFFCRAYNIEAPDTGFTDSEATDDMRRSSINAISELLLHTLGSRDVPQGLRPGGLRSSMSLEEYFSNQRVKTRKDWMLEERIWADALAAHYGVKNVY